MLLTILHEPSGRIKREKKPFPTARKVERVGQALGGTKRHGHQRISRPPQFERRPGEREGQLGRASRPFKPVMVQMLFEVICLDQPFSARRRRRKCLSLAKFPILDSLWRIPLNSQPERHHPCVITTLPKCPRPSKCR